MFGKKRGRGYILEKEELAIQTLKYLLRNDKAALLRVMSSIKRAIWEEESKCLANRVIERAKK
jgi:hypothetical protein